MKLFDKIIIGASIGVVFLWVGARIKKAIDSSKDRVAHRKKMFDIVKRGFELKDDEKAIEKLYEDLYKTARDLAKATPGGASMKERVVVSTIVSCHKDAYQEFHGHKKGSAAETLYLFGVSILANEIVGRMKKRGELGKVKL
jgi:hypothetical protein